MNTIILCVVLYIKRGDLLVSWIHLICYILIKSLKAISYRRQLFTGFLPRRHGFGIKLVRTRFLVRYVSLEKVFLQPLKHSSTCNHPTSAPFRSDFPFNMKWYKIKDHLRSQYQGTQSHPTPVIKPSVREHSSSTSPSANTQNGSDNETVNSTSQPKTYTNYIHQNTSRHLPFIVCARPLFCHPLSSHKLHAYLITVIPFISLP
jgi:hypothetical protein